MLQYRLVHLAIASFLISLHIPEGIFEDVWYLLECFSGVIIYVYSRSLGSYIVQ